MTNKSSPKIIPGNQHSDHRGTVSFINDFDLTPVKRMYTIQHPSTSTVRAWQGHKIESKYFKCTQGRFLVALVKIDNWDEPSPNLHPETFILDSKNTEILQIPAGYANGFKALEANSELLVFSNLNLEEAKEDQFRFGESLWMDWD